MASKEGKKLLAKGKKEINTMMKMHRKALGLPPKRKSKTKSKNSFFGIITPAIK